MFFSLFVTLFNNSHELQFVATLFKEDMTLQGIHRASRPHTSLILAWHPPLTSEVSTRYIIQFVTYSTILICKRNIDH
jgi:hypothetical protein